MCQSHRLKEDLLAWRAAKGRKVSISTWFSHIQGSEGAQQLWATPLCPKVRIPFHCCPPRLCSPSGRQSCRKKWHFQKLPSTYTMGQQAAAAECAAEPQHWAFKPSWTGIRSPEHPVGWPFRTECQTCIPRVTNPPQLFKHLHGWEGTSQEQVSAFQNPQELIFSLLWAVLTPCSDRSSPDTSRALCTQNFSLSNTSSNTSHN